MHGGLMSDMHFSGMLISSILVHANRWGNCWLTHYLSGVRSASSASTVDARERAWTLVSTVQCSTSERSVDGVERSCGARGLAAVGLLQQRRHSLQQRRRGACAKRGVPPCLLRRCC